MTNRELDAMIAERVMGWVKIPANDGFHWRLPNGVELPNGDYWPERYSTNRDKAARVLERIGELRLVSEFEAAFEEVYIADLMNDKGPRWLGAFGRMISPPRLWMEAALKCASLDPATAPVSFPNTPVEAKANHPNKKENPSDE